MSTSKYLSALPVDELKCFFDSFDHIVCDVEGVISNQLEVFNGVKETITALKKSGKTVKYITNNAAVSRVRHEERFNEQGIETNRDEFITPARAIIEYLKGINFDKKVYLVCLPAMMEEFKSAGIKVANEYKPEFIEFSVKLFLATVSKLDDEVGAVVMCLDYNLTYLAMNRAFDYILKPDVLFITTGYVKKQTYAAGKSNLDPSYFHDLLERTAGREPLSLGKPQSYLANYVEKIMGNVPKKILYIGDSLHQDIQFANELGYTSLLVLSGNTKLEDLENADAEETPDYYIDSLASLNNIIRNV